MNASNMSADYHHIEIHTIKPGYLLDLFENVYHFQLIGKRQTEFYSQWILQSCLCRLIISSMNNFNANSMLKIDSNHYDILTSIVSKSLTADYILNRDTVFNVALQVKSIQTILDNNPDLEVIVSPRHARDEYGSIEYACIKSCIGNVVHTLINVSDYSGECLPGFQTISSSKKDCLINDIDHVAFALSKDSSLNAIDWYKKVFGMKRFFVNQQDDPFHGFPVHVGNLGMRLFASEYWKCSEVGCFSENSSNLKFVFAESLIDDNQKSSDQIKRFLSQHQNQSGIQHIGFLCAKNIKESVRIAKINGAEFLTPCSDYYLKENNGHVIESVGENLKELADLGILLDNEGDQMKAKILLQIFTKSIFNNDTFFLELIERRGARGFGAGNIRTLWKIVQQKLDSSRIE